MVIRPPTNSCTVQMGWGDGSAVKSTITAARNAGHITQS